MNVKDLPYLPEQNYKSCGTDYCFVTFIYHLKTVIFKNRNKKPYVGTNQHRAKTFNSGEL